MSQNENGRVHRGMNGESSRRPTRGPRTVRPAPADAPTEVTADGAVSVRPRHRAPIYRVRTATPATPTTRSASSTADAVGVTPPGVHLLGRPGRGGSAHGRPGGRLGWIVRQVLVTLAVFALAVLLVTGIEVVVGHPLSGGDAGRTSLGEVLHPHP